MTNEHSGISRRGLMRAAAVGVPAASLLAFGSTLVTATSASAVSVDGYWGEETSAAVGNGWMMHRPLVPQPCWRCISGEDPELARKIFSSKSRAGVRM